MVNNCKKKTMTKIVDEKEIQVERMKALRKVLGGPSPNVK